MNPGAVIVEAVRTPVGRFRGALKSVRTDHLGALVLNALLQRTGLPAGDVQDVVFGCVTQVGEQCGNIARTSLLGAGWPEAIPGMTVDRKCGSSEAAVHVAAASIAAGVIDVAVAGGAENMTRVPMGGNRDVHGAPFGWKVQERFELTSQGEAAERLCDRWGLDRNALDDYAIESHRRAAAACDAGHFVREIVPVSVGDWAEQGADPGPDLSKDETIRRDTSRERLAGLKASFRAEGGRVSAGNASQISDGAAALVVMSKDKAAELGVTPIAELVGYGQVAGPDPSLLTQPSRAIKRALDGANMPVSAIDLFELNEAFAAVGLASMADLGISDEVVNVNGGAIALGHPVGMSGARVVLTLINELRRRGGGTGAAALCGGGGQGDAAIIRTL